MKRWFPLWSARRTIDRRERGAGGRDGGKKGRGEGEIGGVTPSSTNWREDERKKEGGC